MDEQIKKYLKEHLTLDTTIDSCEYGNSGTLTISLLLDGEEISSVYIDGSDIKNTFIDE